MTSSSINWRACSVCWRVSFGWRTAFDTARPGSLHPFTGSLDFLGERPEMNPAFVEVLKHGDKVVQARARRSSFRTVSVSPSFKVLRQRVRARRLVMAPMRWPVKIFLHPARCNAFNCMSAFWSMVEMRVPGRSVQFYMLRPLACGDPFGENAEINPCFPMIATKQVPQKRWRTKNHACPLSSGCTERAKTIQKSARYAAGILPLVCISTQFARYPLFPEQYINPGDEPLNGSRVVSARN